jgi:hypothetical protein
MTEQKITHNGEEYTIPQNVIDDMMKIIMKEIYLMVL